MRRPPERSDSSTKNDTPRNDAPISFLPSKSTRRRLSNQAGMSRHPEQLVARGQVDGRALGIGGRAHAARCIREVDLDVDLLRAWLRRLSRPDLGLQLGHAGFLLCA